MNDKVIIGRAMWKLVTDALGHAMGRSTLDVIEESADVVDLVAVGTPLTVGDFLRTAIVDGKLRSTDIIWVIRAGDAK